MPQPKPSTTEMSMPTFETLEEWTRSQIQSLMQSVLDEEVTHALGRSRYERQAPLDAPGGYRNGYGKRRRLSLPSGCRRLGLLTGRTATLSLAAPLKIGYRCC